MKQILYATAKNNSGDIVLANNAQKGPSYFCIVCGGELILRKSEKGKRRPHYAHKNLTVNCTPESALHQGFKSLLYERLKSALADKKQEADLEWKCDFCSEVHNINLLDGAVEVRMESSLEGCRPDIVIFSENGKPLKAIEVVVTHFPEPEVENYLKNNGISLVRFDLKDEESLKLLQDQILKASSVSYCPNPKCEKCGLYKKKIKLRIAFTECYNCSTKIKKALATVGSSYYGPDNFSADEVILARTRGAVLNAKFSNMAQETYLANICPTCKQMQGKHYLVDCYMDEAPVEEIHELGFGCERCLQEANKLDGSCSVFS